MDAHQKGTIAINWVPTTKLPVDGLTKLLSPKKHAKFVKMLRLVELRPGQV